MLEDEKRIPENENLNEIKEYVTEYRNRPLLPGPTQENESRADANVESVRQETDWQRRHRIKEENKDATRLRVRNAIGSKEYFHKGKPTPTIKDEAEKTVAVYARVSTNTEEQISSIENQQMFYEKKINENDNWQLHKIYSDEGKSGMNVKNRPEFLQMISDAKDGKMDLVLCASVSRFARNIEECLKYITDLKTANPRHPVGVYFETENIYTLDPNSTQTLQFHAMLADWESENKSRRMVLSYDQRICTGQYPVSDLLGYRHTKDGDLIIVPEEAKTVRFVFLSLLAGKSCESIASVLTEKGRTTLKGNVDWCSSMVREITQNERRWGDLEARKKICIDPKRKIVIDNDGERDWAFVPGHHEGIVTPEIAKAAQAMLGCGGRLENGLPSIEVIENGALKGFVSVSPYWTGISEKVYLDACLSVYDDQELQDMEQMIGIRNGDVHSNVFSMELTGYSVPPGIVFLTNGMPTMTISKKAIRFNKACHTKLDDCERIEMFYHPVLQTIVIREGISESGNSFRWVNESGNNITTISTRIFSKIVYESMHWNEECQFRFRGITKVRDGAKIIIFTLDEHQVVTRKRKKPGVSSQDDDPGLNTSYQTDESAMDYSESSAFAYKEEWSRTAQVQDYLRRRRETIMSSFTREDICRSGTAIVNPMIGALPSRQEILQELDDLLMTM